MPIPPAIPNNMASVDGSFVCGGRMPAAGTSEFHSLSADEIVEIVRITRAAAGPEAQIFAPVGYQVKHAIDAQARRRHAV